MTASEAPTATENPITREALDGLAEAIATIRARERPGELAVVKVWSRAGHLEGPSTARRLEPAHASDGGSR